MAIMSSPGSSPITRENYESFTGKPYSHPDYEYTRAPSGSGKKGWLYGGGLMQPPSDTLPQEQQQQGGSGAQSGGGGASGSPYTPPSIPMTQPSQMPELQTMQQQNDPLLTLAGGMNIGMGPWYPEQYAWRINNQQPWSLQF